MNQILKSITDLLAVAPEGLSAPELRAQLSVRISQPTLWRRLEDLRARGSVIVEGRARATRYHSTVRNDGALRSRRLHEVAARRLLREPGLLDIARARLDELRTVNPHGRVYHDRWHELISAPRERLLKAMTEDSEAADALRKESPFTILVPAKDRRRVFQALAP